MLSKKSISFYVQQYLNGQLIENNDLSETDLRKRIKEGFAASVGLENSR